MRKSILLCASLFATAFLVAAPAQASNARTWVSSSGTNTGTCPQTAPCATFAFAIGVTSSGGEIDCLSGGDFGPVTISQPITIDCGAGQVGAIGVTNSTDAITLNLSSGTVILRNLSLNYFGTIGGAGFGIDVSSSFPGTLIVQHCSINGFSGGIGIVFQVTGARGLLEVSDTTFSGSDGISVTAGTGAIASVVLNRIEMTGNAVTGGLFLSGEGTIAGTMRQSVVAGNGSGISANASAGVYFTIEESSIIDNLQYGIKTANTGVHLEVGASTIGGNGTGVDVSAGSIFTFGNNQMSANGTNGSFTGTTPLE